MRTRLKVLAASTAAALLGGCGGGGGGGTNPVEGLLGITICAPLGLPADCGKEARARRANSAAESKSSPPAYQPTTFTKWSDHLEQGWTNIQAPGLETVTPYEYDVGAAGSIHATAESSFNSGATTVFRVEGETQIKNFYTHGVELKPTGSSGSDVLAGQPGIQVLKRYGDSPQAVFADVTHQSIGLIANPYTLGWDYQSFGVWNDATDTAAKAVGATSFGSATPATAVPITGSATFTGKLGGLYISPTGQGSMTAADLTVNANFNARSLSFASTGTTTGRDLTTSTAASHLNLSGTLTYSPNSSSFTGTLSNAGGTMSGKSNGQFYGPAAQELGGVFTVKSPSTVETFTGAYGAKR